MTSSGDTRDGFLPADVLIISALTEEHQVVRAVLRSVAKHAGTKGQADLWCYSTPDQKSYIIATASAHAQGTNPMAVATGSWLESIDPGSAVLVGIAAAVKTKGIELGYVPFVEQVVGYGDIAVKAGKLTFRSSGFQVDAKMRVSAGQLRSAPEPYTAWQKECRSVINTIIPIINSMRAAKVVSPVPADVPDPHLIVGVMGSGPFLLRDADFRDKLVELPSEIVETTISAGISVGGPIHPKLVSAEMEAHGFMEACHQKEVPACVLKGISDLGDAAKAALEERSGGFFRAYACSNAVLALLHMLRQTPRLPRHEHEAMSVRLAEGSRHFYDRLVTNPEGRFHCITIAEILLPSAEIHERVGYLFDPEVKLDGQRLSQRSALEKLWQKGVPHALVKGEAGMGKTVTLLQIWRQYLTEGGPIPIFVVLNEYSQAEPARRGSWLTDYILRNYLNEEVPSESTRTALWKWLKTDRITAAPKFLFLLDGWNEISVDRKQLVLDLQDWRENAPGGQILLTSRHESTFTWASNFQHIDLLPLSLGQIQSYLDRFNQPMPKDPLLTAVLANPMMLTIYAASNEVIERYSDNPWFNFTTSPKRGPEVLSNFLEAQLATLTERCVLDEQELSLHRWLLDHLLPWLGYRMESLDTFELSLSGIEDLFGAYLVHAAFSAELDEKGAKEAKRGTSRGDATQKAPCWSVSKLLRNVRGLPRHTPPRKSSTKSAENGQRVVVGESSLWRERIRLFRKCERTWLELEEGKGKDPDRWLRIIEKDLKFLTPTGVHSYGFRHQYLRDYFSARHILNETRLALATRGFPLCMIERPLPIYVSRMLGQLAALDAHSDRPIELNHANGNLRALLDLLEKCRGRFLSDTPAYTVWNLVNIFVETKGDLVGVNLRCLDLSGVRLNTVKLSSADSAAVFDQSLIREQDLFPQGHSRGVIAVAYHPDGSRLLSGSRDGSIREWSTQTRECLRTFGPYQKEVQSVAYHPSGERVAAGFGPGGWAIREWSTVTGELLHRYGDGYSDTTSLAYHPDGSRLLAGSYDASVREWSTQSGECIRVYAGHLEASTHRLGVLSVIYNRDGERLFSGAGDETIREWDSTGACRRVYKGHTGGVFSLTLGPDGLLLASGSEDGTIKEWSIETGQCLRTYSERLTKGEDEQEEWTWYDKAGAIYSIAYSPDGSRLLSGLSDGTIKEWSTETGQCLRTYQAHPHYVSSVTYNRSGTRFASGGGDGRVLEWSAYTGERIGEFHSNISGIAAATYSRDGSRVLAGGKDGSIKEWSAKDGAFLYNYESHSLGIAGVAYDRNDNVAMSVDEGGCLKESSVKTGGLARTVSGPLSAMDCVAFHPDGKRIASAKLFGRVIIVWDLRSGEVLREFGAHHSLQALAFAPDGALLLSCGESASDGWDPYLQPCFKEWSLESFECLHTYWVHEYRVSALAYHPVGHRFASGNEGWGRANRSTVCIKEWSAQTGECLGIYEVKSEISALAYDPKGTRLLCGGKDGSLVEWSTDTGRQVRQYRGHSQEITSLSYCPDGSRFISGCLDNTVKEWSTANGHCLNRWQNVRGLDVRGCSFRDLHPSSNLREESIWVLEAYGAVFGQVRTDDGN